MARALTGTDPATAIAMFFFALLLAGRSFSQAGATQIGMTRFAGSTVTAQELEVFAACTWPLDVKASGKHFSTMKAGFDADDASTGLAVVFFIAIGAAVMFVDSCELAKEEEQREKEKAVPQSAAKFLAASDSQPWRLAIMAPSFLIFGLAFALKSPLSDVSVECQRAPLLAAKHNALTSLDAVALEELMRLPSFGLQHHRLAAVGDGMSVLFLIAFVLLGALCLCADAFDMAAEVEHERRSNDGKEKRTQASSSSFTSTSSRQSIGRHSKSWPRASLLLVFALVALAFISVDDVEQRPASRELAFEELEARRWTWNTWRNEGPSLRGLAAPDSAVIVLVFMFVGFGWLVSRFDFQELYAEEQEAEKKEDGKQQADKHSKRRLPEKTEEKRVSWSSYLSEHSRMISCVVLLLSVCAGIAATLFDTHM